MKSSKIIISSLHLLLIVLVISLGLFFIALPYTPVFSVTIINMVEQTPFVFLKIGIFTLVFAFLLSVGLYFMYKRQFVKISMKKNRSDIDTKIVSIYIEDYLKGKYPKNKVSAIVNVLPSKKLEIIASFDTVKDHDKPHFLFAISFLQYYKIFLPIHSIVSIQEL